MSIKIYQAFKVPIKQLNEALAAIETSAIKNIVAKVKKLCEYKAASNPTATPSGIYYSVVEDLRTASESARRDPFSCVDASIATFIDGASAYMIPHGENFVFKGLEPTALLKDYAYWNNTDEPEGMSRREWGARKRKWLKLLDQPCLNYYIIHFDRDYVESYVKLEKHFWDKLSEADRRAGKKPW